MEKTKDIVEEIFTLIEIIELKLTKRNSEAESEKECSTSFND